MGYSKPQKTLQHFEEVNSQLFKRRRCEIQLPVPQPLATMTTQQQLSPYKFKQVEIQAISQNSKLSLEEQIEIENDKSTAPPVKNHCKCQFKSAQEVNQHNKSKKHIKNLISSQTIFSVGTDIITNKDYEKLIESKGWLSDAVSASSNLMFFSDKIFF